MEITAMGHTVKLMAPQFVKPYVKMILMGSSSAPMICRSIE